MVLRSVSFGLAGALFMVLGFFNGVKIGSLINFQAMVIVFGGIALVTIVGFSRERVIDTWSAIKKVFSAPRRNDRNHLLQEIFRLASIYRIHGPLALERALDTVENDFLRYGALFVAEGYDEGAFTHALERELYVRNQRALSRISLIKTLMRLAPSLGMAGTVISLMQVMGRLDAISSANTALAVALSSTLYGVLLANLVLLPIAAKLEQMADEEFDTNSMILESLIAIARTEHPMRIAERFNAYHLYQTCKESGNLLAAEASGTQAIGA